MAALARGRVVVHRLGLVGYQECFDFQQKLQKDRIEGRIPDTLLLVEHPAVFTAGKRGQAQDVLWDEDYCKSKGVEMVRSSRGGLVTCHAPGQLVGYPIVDVQALHNRVVGENKGQHIRWFVSKLGQVVCGALREAGVRQAVHVACPPEKVGVWVGVLKSRKICSIGLQVRRWVSMHGFAVNVNNDLTLFDGIVPCGIDGRPMTSVQRELQHFAHEHVSASTNPAMDDPRCFMKNDEETIYQQHLIAEQIRPDGAPKDRSDVNVAMFAPKIMQSFEEHFGVVCEEETF